MRPQLPHGATGIEFGNSVIEFRKGKVVALAKNRDEHYTLHSGEASGILDVHRTWREADGTEHHQTLFAIHRSDLPAFLKGLSSIQTGMLRLFRPLRVGWLHWNHIGVVRGIDPATDADITAITRKRPGKKRLTVDETKVRAGILAPEFLDEIWDFPDGSFSLFKRGQRIGVGIKATDRTGQVHLYWFKLRDISKLFNEFEAHLLAAVSKYAIPKERYREIQGLRCAGTLSSGVPD